MNLILVSISVFSLVVFFLVVSILLAEKNLVNQNDVEIIINDEKSYRLSLVQHF
jgi:Na+-transporting NADH:ubiquinone oxidoreductase subunit NqrF